MSTGAESRHAETHHAASHVYDATFFDYIEAGSRRSARRLIALMNRHIPPASVLDVGAGRGAWLAEWQAAGVNGIHGVDGAYVDQSRLLIDSARFTSTDLSRPFDLGRRFDLVQCLEVAEHIPAGHAGVLAGNLARHGDLILFSAAVPGQGGEFHVNEQPYGYWHGLFRAHGFRVFDLIRPALHRDRTVEPWYRYNAFLFATPERAASLPPAVLEWEIPAGAAIGDYASLFWRMRNAVIRSLPPAVHGRLVRLKHRAVATAAGWRR